MDGSKGIREILTKNAFTTPDDIRFASFLQISRRGCLLAINEIRSRNMVFSWQIIDGPVHAWFSPLEKSQLVQTKSNISAEWNRTVKLSEIGEVHRVSCFEHSWISHLTLEINHTFLRAHFHFAATSLLLRTNYTGSISLFILVSACLAFARRIIWVVYLRRHNSIKSF